MRQCLLPFHYISSFPVEDAGRTGVQVSTFFGAFLVELTCFFQSKRSVKALIRLFVLLFGYKEHVRSPKGMKYYIIFIVTLTLSAGKNEICLQ